MINYNTDETNESLDLKRNSILFQGARFRDTSQQIHKQWHADPSRAFPTVGNVTTTANSGSGGANNKNGVPASMTGDAASSTPNSTPSPSPSPTNSQTVTVSAFESCSCTGCVTRNYRVEVEDAELWLR